MWLWVVVLSGCGVDRFGCFGLTLVPLCVFGLL